MRTQIEIKEYNFWRNLYGTKGIALSLYLIIFIREIIIKGTVSLKELFLYPYPDHIALIVIVLCIVFVVFFVNQKTVKQKGFDYAKTLIEVCERIPVNIV